MCGRFVRRTALRDFADMLLVDVVASDLHQSYNIAPTNPVAVVMEDGIRKLVTMRWGLIPRWSKDPSVGRTLINARAETIDEKPSFAEAFNSRRCLILADGFYEWKQEAGKKPGTTPVYIHMKSNQPFCMAGIYETGISPAGEKVASCCIVTTAANELVGTVHHRMPVILAARDHDVWLNPASDPAEVKKLMVPFCAEEMACHEVSRAVNSPHNNTPGLIEPAGNAKGDPSLFDEQ